MAEISGSSVDENGSGTTNSTSPQNPRGIPPCDRAGLLLCLQTFSLPSSS